MTTIPDGFLDWYLSGFYDPNHRDERKNMSKRRPVGRIVAKNKKTGRYVDLGTVWPVHEKIGTDEGNITDGPRSVRFGSSGNRNPDYDVPLDVVAGIIMDQDDWFIDLKEPFQRDEDDF